MTKKDEVIHSGHFMIANVHDGPDASATPLRDGQVRFDIDSSLQRLFTCMNEAYKNGVTTPRWKNFNGMKIRLKDRIRLNNAIWRCWHIEYANRTVIPGGRPKPNFIQFITPLDSSTQKRKKPPQVTKFEDDYWKRRNKAVVSEYLQWRKYYWKPAAKTMKRKKEKSKKSIEQNADMYKPLPPEALVVDEGFFSEIFDSLHSHALPDPGICAPDMSNFGFETPLMYDPNDDNELLLENHSFEPNLMPKLLDSSSNFPQQNSSDMFQYKQDNNTLISPPPPVFQQQHGQNGSNGKQLGFQQMPNNQSRNQYQGKQPATTLLEPPQPEKMSRMDDWPNPPKVNQKANPEPNQEAMPLNLEVLDQNGQVTLPNGQKVVLVSVMEDGSFMQIKGSKYGEKVVFRSQQESSPPPPPPQMQQQIKTDLSKQQSREQAMPSTSYRSSISSPQVSTRSSTSSSRTYDIMEQGHTNEQAVFKYETVTYNGETELDYELKEVPSRVSVVQEEARPDPDELTAEQKRRFTMKKGFETLEAMLSGEVSGQGGSTGPKMSKAAVLNKAKDYIMKISRDQKRLKTEIDIMKRETDNLQAQLNHAQEQLPANGLPLAKPSNNKVMVKFSEYVAEQTRSNYKYYVFSRIMKRLFESYINVVSTNDHRQLRSSTNQWVDVQCSISHMRQISADVLRALTKDTCIVEDNMIGQFPATCVQFAEQEANQRYPQHISMQYVKTVTHLPSCSKGFNHFNN